MASGAIRSGAVPRAEVVIGDSYREAGRSFGAAHAEQIVRQVESYRPLYELLGLSLDQVTRRAATELLKPADSVLGDYVDELRGRAEGAGVPFLELFLLNCQEEVSLWVAPQKWDELEERWPSRKPGAVDGCTTLALRAGGHTVFGHTEDWTAVDLENAVALHDVTTPDGTRILALQSPGIVPWQGMSSHGVTATANTLLSTDARPGVPNALVLRWVLEARTLEEVYARLCLPQRAMGTYVLAGDASGRVWSIQTSATRSSCLPVDDWVVQTNHYTHDSLTALQRRPVWPDSLGRHERARALVSAGMAAAERPTPWSLQELAVAVLRDHGGEGMHAICVHPQGAGMPRVLDDATVSAVVYEPLRRRMHACVGPLCRGELETFELR